MSSRLTSQKIQMHEREASGTCSLKGYRCLQFAVFENQYPKIGGLMYMCLSCSPVTVSDAGLF